MFSTLKSWISNTRKISGSGNSISLGSSRVRRCSFEIRGEGNTIDVQGSFVLGARFVIHGSGNRIVIHSDCSMNDNSEFSCFGDNGSIEVGRGSTSQGSIVQSHQGAGVSIGEDCLLAWQSGFLTGDFHDVFSVTDGSRVNTPQGISVGNKVWVGSKACVLKGVQIPDGCIIGIGSIVTRHAFEGNSVIAGNPARSVKSGVRWN